MSSTYLHLQFTLLVHLFSRLFALIIVLYLVCDSTDLDPLQGRCKVVVERERIVQVDVPPWWVLL